jgi:NhaP-type Na+/H+ or K+/H+ antiporter
VPQDFVQEPQSPYVVGGQSTVTFIVFVVVVPSILTQESVYAPVAVMIVVDPPERGVFGTLLPKLDPELVQAVAFPTAQERRVDSEVA